METSPSSKETVTQRRPPGRPRRESLDGELLDAALAEMSRAGYVRMNLDSVAARRKAQLAEGADVELGISMLVGSLYALYSAGTAVSRDWATRVVDAWLGANGAA